MMRTKPLKKTAKLQACLEMWESLTRQETLLIPWTYLSQVAQEQIRPVVYKAVGHT